MKRFVLFYLLTASTLTPLHAAELDNAAQASDRAQIQQLVDHFKGAIIAKDAEALRGMFLPGGSWLQGLDKASLALMLTKQPHVHQFETGNYDQFAKFVATSDKPIEETFRNVRIETDGTVGMVYFDYQFLQDGKVQNRGVETWQLTHTKDGWKIAAMLYSVILDDIH